jgi:hypothetical protein
MESLEAARLGNKLIHSARLSHDLLGAGAVGMVSVSKPAAAGGAGEASGGGGDERGWF